MRCRLRVIRVWSLVLAVALAACGGGSSSPRARYFAFDGAPAFVASRNIAGRSVDEIGSLLDKARGEGTTLVRFHVTHAFGPGINATGDVEEAWAASWDEVFTRAEADGIHLLPVFGVWADWNDGSAGETWHSWQLNPLNAANGGPASSPAELYRSGSAGQRAWLRWLGQVVARWQARGSVAAWEVFSELDLVTHAGGGEAFQAGAVSFVEAAASTIRQADPARRPVTASLASWDRWPGLYRSAAIDLVQVHLYGPGVNLDTRIAEVAPTLRSYGKPMLLGESGLDWRPPDGTTATTDPLGPLATRHAVWTALVNGFMNGRALWWEDGYAILQNGDPSVPFVTGYPAVEEGPLAFLGGRDLGDTQVLAVHGGLRGGALGDAQTVLAWFNDPDCGFPEGNPAYACTAVKYGRVASVEVLGGAPRWQAVFHDATTGAALGEPATFTRSGSRVEVTLPDFTDDVALVLSASP